MDELEKQLKSILDSPGELQRLAQMAQGLLGGGDDPGTASRGGRPRPPADSGREKRVDQGIDPYGDTVTPRGETQRSGFAAKTTSDGASELSRRGASPGAEASRYEVREEDAAGLAALKNLFSAGNAGGKRALVDALAPYLGEKRRGKLYRAASLASAARLAEKLLGEQGGPTP